MLEKRKTEELAKNKPAEAQATATATETAPETPAVNSDEKKQNTGVLTLVIGGALLLASFGAINYFRKQ